MQNNKWKDYLLKSGLPLEFEVKKVLDKLGFCSKSEFAYLRENENNILTEFSYDLDSEILIKEHCFELLIECKYRDESTNWLFLPEDYNESTRGIGSTDFRNTNDFFYPKDYNDKVFKYLNLIKISPLCSKGIEICSTGPNPKTIDQAISQISYAVVDKVILAMEKQLKGNQEELFIYHHVPVIVTTANLFRLNANVTIESIKGANNIQELSSKHDVLLIEPTISLDLKKYAYKKLSDFEAKYSKEYLNKCLNSKFKEHGRDFEYYKDEIASFPNGIIVMTHSQNGHSFKKLLTVFKDIVQPSKKIVDKLKMFVLDVKE